MFPGELKSRGFKEVPLRVIRVDHLPDGEYIRAVFSDLLLNGKNLVRQYSDNILGTEYC